MPSIIENVLSGHKKDQVIPDSPKVQVKIDEKLKESKLEPNVRIDVLEKFFESHYWTAVKELVARQLLAYKYDMSVKLSSVSRGDKSYGSSCYYNGKLESAQDLGFLMMQWKQDGNWKRLFLQETKTENPHLNVGGRNA